MTDHKLRKAERLYRRKEISALFEDGNSAKSYPVRVIWKRVDKSSDYPAQAAFSVPRKLYKRAVMRNRLKRLMREAYRLQKHTLYSKIPPEQQIHLMLIYTSREVLSFKEVSAAVSKIIYRLTENL